MIAVKEIPGFSYILCKSTQRPPAFVIRRSPLFGETGFL